PGESGAPPFPPPGRGFLAVGRSAPGARLSGYRASARTAVMTYFDRPPVVGIPACRVPRDGFAFHQVGDKYVDSVIDGASALPLLIPALGPRLDFDALLAELDGLLIDRTSVV